MLMSMRSKRAQPKGLGAADGWREALEQQKEKRKSSPAAAQSSAVSARRMLDPTASRMASGDATFSSSARLLLLLLVAVYPVTCSTLIEGSPESTATSTTTESPYFKHQSGRHVCTKEQAVTEPVKTRESYCIPSYKSYYLPCDTGMCRRYRVVYETAYRDVVKYHVSHKTSYSCCPGWTQTSKASHGCTKAVCDKKCDNGGSCLKPNFCGCRPGYAGSSCELDIDECSMKQHTCSQSCVNTFGSYFCKCLPGYVLLPDGKSCQIRENKVTTTTTTTEASYKERDIEELEDHDFAVEFVNLNKRINKIEKLMHKPSNGSITNSRFSVTAVEVLAKLDTLIDSQKIMKNRIDLMEKKIDNSRKQLNRRSKKLAAEDELRLHHITRQIAMLNKRLDDCACGAANDIEG